MTSKGQTTQAQECPAAAGEGAAAGQARALRRALGQYPTGVAVMTAAHAGRRSFVTANSFASVSLSPPLVLWSLRRASGSLDVFRRATHFAVNVLSVGQADLAVLYARPDAEEASPGPDAGLGAAPLIEGVAAAFECRRVREHDGGDHVILIGEVERYRLHDRSGLVFSQGRYAEVIEGGEARDREMPAPSPDAEGLPLLLLQAADSLGRAHAADREAMGLDLDRGLVLAHLARHPRTPPDALAGAARLGVAAAADAATGLVALGLVRVESGGLVLTPEGSRIQGDLEERARALERARLSGFGADEVAVARRVLSALGAGETGRPEWPDGGASPPGRDTR